MTASSPSSATAGFIGLGNQGGGFGGASPGVRATAALLRKDVGLAGRLAAERSLDADLLMTAADRVLAAMDGTTSR
jgi:hypothetical protein